MTKLIEDLAAELIRQAYAEGYAQGKFDAEMEGQFEKVKRVVEETPQAKRDRIVEQAKADFNGWNVSTVEYVVNKRKRTIACLIYGPDTGKVVRKGIAKCAPGDCFNEHIGKAIALRRALGLEIPFEYLSAPQPTEVRVGDLVRLKLTGRWDGNIETVTGFNYKGKPVTDESPGYVDENQYEIIDDSREEVIAD